MSSPPPLSPPPDSETVVRKSVWLSRRVERRLQNLATVALLNPSELLVAGVDLYTLYLQGSFCVVDATGQNPIPVFFTWSNSHNADRYAAVPASENQVEVSLGLRRRQWEKIQALAVHAHTSVTNLLVDGAELYFLYQSDALRVQADDARLGRLTLSFGPLPPPRTL
jgi:hypothetical protein